jgi:multidrug efflux system outer membrane protein
MNVTKSNIAWLFLWSCIVIFSLASCKVSEDYKREEQYTPSTFRTDFPKDSSITNLPWWELFKDTVLVDLINTALIENKNIQIAVARMEESLLYFDISKADFYPSISYGFVGSSSINSQTSGTANTLGPGINVSYTIDLWQKIKSMNEAALQEYYATEEAYKSLNISIISAVARAYISLRDIDNRLIIAEKTTKNFQDNLDVMQARFNAGFISEVDLAQSKIQLSEAKTAIEVFVRARNQIENGINILLGSTQKDIPRGLSLFEQFGSPVLPVGLAYVLLNR